MIKTAHLQWEAKLGHCSGSRQGSYGPLPNLHHQRNSRHVRRHTPCLALLCTVQLTVCSRAARAHRLGADSHLWVYAQANQPRLRAAFLLLYQLWVGCNECCCALQLLKVVKVERNSSLQGKANSQRSNTRVMQVGPTWTDAQVGCHCVDTA